MNMMMEYGCCVRRLATYASVLTHKPDRIKLSSSKIHSISPQSVFFQIVFIKFLPIYEDQKGMSRAE